MGEVTETITLMNGGDIISAERGYMPEMEVRQMTVESLVDTGAGYYERKHGYSGRRSAAGVQNNRAGYDPVERSLFERPRIGASKSGVRRYRRNPSGRYPP